MTVQKNKPIEFLTSASTIVHNQLRQVFVVKTEMNAENARDTMEMAGFACDLVLVIDPRKIKPKDIANG